MDNIDEVLQKLQRLLLIPICDDKGYKKEAIPDEMQQQVFQSQVRKCYLCGAKTAQPVIHHIVPNGSSGYDNLVMLCNTCHYWLHLILSRYLGYRKAIRTYGYLPYG